MNKQLTFLVDINVCIDSYIAGDTRHKESIAFVNTALEHNVSLLYGASKLETIFYLVRSETKRVLCQQKGSLFEPDTSFAQQYAWSCIENLCEIATAVGVDQSDLWLARKYRVYHPDLEDNVLLAGVERCNPDYLVTWDKGLLKTPLPLCAPSRLRRRLRF